MPEIIDGNLVASADDDAVAAFKQDLNNGINWLQNARDAWPGMTNAEKQTWLLNNFDTVLYILLRVLKFIKWLVRRL